MTKDEIIKYAAKGGPPLIDFDNADMFLFLCMRALYSHAKVTGMDPEAGAAEKHDILARYDKMKLWERIVQEHWRKERDFEGAWETFAKNPTLENAEALHKAWSRSGLKVYASATEEERKQEWKGTD